MGFNVKFNTNVSDLHFLPGLEVLAHEVEKLGTELNDQIKVLERVSEKVENSSVEDISLAAVFDISQIHLCAQYAASFEDQMEIYERMILPLDAIEQSLESIIYHRCFKNSVWKFSRARCEINNRPVNYNDLKICTMTAKFFSQIPDHLPENLEKGIPECPSHKEVFPQFKESPSVDASFFMKIAYFENLLKFVVNLKAEVDGLDSVSFRPVQKLLEEHYSDLILEAHQYLESTEELIKKGVCEKAGISTLIASTKNYLSAVSFISSLSKGIPLESLQARLEECLKVGIPRLLTPNQQELISVLVQKGISQKDAETLARL